MAKIHALVIMMSAHVRGPKQNVFANNRIYSNVIHNILPDRY